MTYPARRRYAGRPARSGGKPPGKSREQPRNAGRPGAAGLLVRLGEGRERSLKRRHPWVFSGAIEHVEGEPAAGDTVRLESAAGEFIAWAAYSPASQIRCRVLSFAEEDFPDEAWLRRVVGAAIAYRRTRVPASVSNAVRLIHAESDELPGVIVDRYADWLVVQLLSAGAERRREAIVRCLAEATGCSRIFERSDAEVRALEGLPQRVGVLAGEAPGAPVAIEENALRYGVDIRTGQKTGFYLDQRDNRARIRTLAAGREVLNCFAYTGGFALAALAGGARSVLSLDSSAAALALAQENARLNGMDPLAAHWQEADVFSELRRLRSADRTFDLIVVDPPKFAPTARQAEAAARGYKDINLNAFKLLRPDGLLATFSCSGGISAELFQKILAGAAADAGVCATIEERFHAAADHPVRLEFPEGEYLKGLLLRRR
jgi:23S rRNA (cytosine1962-C5)-methyltransferase